MSQRAPRSAPSTVVVQTTGLDPEAIREKLSAFTNIIGR